MWRVTFSLRTCLAFVLFSCVVLLYLHSTHTAVSSILHIRLYHSLDRYFLSKTCRTHKRCPVSLSGPERLYSPVPPRPACSRPPDLVTSNELEEPHHVFEGKARISRPVDRAGAHVLPRFSPTIQVAAGRPLRPQSVLSVIRIKEDERSLPRYHISRLAFGGLEHLHNLRRPCRHQRRAPVVTRLVHISPAGKQDSNMRGSIAPARGEEGSQPILVRGVDLE